MILCRPEGIWNIAFVAQPLLKCHFAAQIAKNSFIPAATLRYNSI